MKYRDRWSRLLRERSLKTCSPRRREEDEEMDQCVEMTRSLERIALAGVGRNRFVPTQEWVTSWQQGMLLCQNNPLSIFLTDANLGYRLTPVMWSSPSCCKGARSAGIAKQGEHNPAIIDFLASANLSHVLPRPPSITPRRLS